MSYITIFELREKLKRLSRIEDEKIQLEREYAISENPILKAEIKALEYEYNKIGNEFLKTPAFEGDC